MNWPSGITALAVKSGAKLPIFAFPADMFLFTEIQKEEVNQKNLPLLPAKESICAPVEEEILLGVVVVLLI